MSAVPSTPSSGQQNLALWGSTFAFTVCFAVWTIFSIIGIQIGHQTRYFATHDCGNHLESRGIADAGQ